MTYKDLVELIEEMSDTHKLVQHFAYGMFSDIKPEADKTPYVFLMPQSHRIDRTSIIYNFDLLVMDWTGHYANNKDRYLLVQDRLIKIILDILSHLEYNFDDKVHFVKSGGFTTSVERFDDEVICVSYALSVVVPNALNECDAPFSVDITNDFLLEKKFNSLETLVKMFRLVGTDHKMITTFGYGFLSDIKLGEIPQVYYPYVFLLPAEHTYSQNKMTYRFNMIVMDIVKNEVSFDTIDFKNTLTIQSNCIQYGLDILAKIKYDPTFSNITILDNPSITTFVERFDDDVSGATFLLEVETKQNLDYCSAPF